MYIRLIRNQPTGSAITGRLLIDGRWFCNTLERVGYQIPALCYPVRITISPKFKRPLPLVCNVPRLPLGGTPSNSEASNSPKGVQYPAAECRTGIRFHRGTKPEHSTGCILVVADNKNDNTDNLRPNRTRSDRSNECEIRTLSKLSSKHILVGDRSAADVENQLTQLLLKAQQEHEEIILEVTDFRPGTELGYNIPCPSSEWACEKEIRSANFARRHSSSILEATSFSDDC